MNELITFEYGAMSSRYSCQAANKLTAYVTMCYHYDRQNHLIVIYSPEDCKNDQWWSFDGKVSKRLDEIFGGNGAFDQYTEDHIEEIKECYKTIKQLC